MEGTALLAIPPRSRNSHRLEGELLSPGRRHAIPITAMGSWVWVWLFVGEQRLPGSRCSFSIAMMRIYCRSDCQFSSTSRLLFLSSSFWMLGLDIKKYIHNRYGFSLFIVVLFSALILTISLKATVSL